MSIGSGIAIVGIWAAGALIIIFGNGPIWFILVCLVMSTLFLS